MFAPSSIDVVTTTTVGGIPGEDVLASVEMFYAGVVAVTLWPKQRQPKGELGLTGDTRDWK